jgi:hypothetical protein
MAPISAAVIVDDGRTLGFAPLHLFFRAPRRAPTLRGLHPARQPPNCVGVGGVLHELGQEDGLQRELAREALEALGLKPLSHRPTMGSHDRGVTARVGVQTIEAAETLEGGTLALREERRQDAVDDDAPDRKPHLRERSGKLDRLGGRHLFRDGDEHDSAGALVLQEGHGALRVTAQKPRRHDVENDLGHAEHVEPMAGGRCVEKDHIVFERTVGALLRRVPPGLAEHGPLLHSGHGAQKRAHVAVVEERPIEGAAVKNQRAVLFEGQIGLHVDGPDIVCNKRNLRSDGGGPEHRAQALFGVAKGHENALAFGCQREGFGRTHGRLANTALAGHEDESLVGERRHQGAERRIARKRRANAW